MLKGLATGPSSRPRVSGRGLAGKQAIVFLAFSLALYAAGAVFVTGPERTPWWIALYAGQWVLFVAILWKGRFQGAFGVWTLLVAALTFRLVLSSTSPWLSDDLYRYLLDGRVLADGINPFRYAPSAPVIRALQPGLSGLVNHPEVPTIYPPLVQLGGLFAAWLHLGAQGWRVAMSFVDLAAIVALAQLFGDGDGVAAAAAAGRLDGASSLRRFVADERGWKAAAVYGLCPLAVWETGANGHLEALTVLFLVLAMWAWRNHRFRWAGAALGAAGLVKLFPILLLPLFFRRRGFWPLAVSAFLVFVLGWLPFVWHGVDVTVGLRTYLAHWSFNSPIYAGFAALLTREAIVRLLPFLVLAGGMIAVVLRRADPLRALPFLLFGFLLSGPTLQPWYALWVLAFLGPRPQLGLLAFVGAMGLSYEVWWEVVQQGEWRIATAWNVLIWSLVALGWLAEGIRGGRRVSAPKAAEQTVGEG